MICCDDDDDGKIMRREIDTYYWMAWE